MNKKLDIIRKIKTRLPLKPFECDEVYFFQIGEHDQLEALDEHSSKWLDSHNLNDTGLFLKQTVCNKFQRYKTIKENNCYYFYMTIIHGSLLLVLSKKSNSEENKQFFNSYFAEQVSIYLNHLIGCPNTWDFIAGESENDLIHFSEIGDYYQCKELYREEYGGEVWLAIKSGKGVVCVSDSEESLRKNIAELGIEQPVLIIAPDEEESNCDSIKYNNSERAIGREENGAERKVYKKRGMFRSFSWKKN